MYRRSEKRREIPLGRRKFLSVVDLECSLQACDDTMAGVRFF